MIKLFSSIFFVLLLSGSSGQTNNSMLAEFLNDAEFSKVLTERYHQSCDTIVVVDTSKLFVNWNSKSLNKIILIQRNYKPLSADRDARASELLSWKCKIQITKIEKEGLKYKIHFFNRLSQITGYFQYEWKNSRYYKTASKIGQF